MISRTIGNTVWAEEGGYKVSIRPITEGKIIIEIIKMDEVVLFDVVVFSLTVGRNRWNRLVRSVARSFDT